MRSARLFCSLLTAEWICFFFWFDVNLIFKNIIIIICAYMCHFI